MINDSYYFRIQTGIMDSFFCVFVRCYCCSRHVRPINRCASGKSSFSSFVLNVSQNNCDGSTGRRKKTLGEGCKNFCNPFGDYSTAIKSDAVFISHLLQPPLVTGQQFHLKIENTAVEDSTRKR